MRIDDDIYECFAYVISLDHDYLKILASRDYTCKYGFQTQLLFSAKWYQMKQSGKLTF